MPFGQMSSNMLKTTRYLFKISNILTITNIHWTVTNKKIQPELIQDEKNNTFTERKMKKL